MARNSKTKILGSKSMLFENAQSKIEMPEYLLIAGLINFAVIIFVIFMRNNLPPVVPLFYGLAYGSERLAASNLLILPSILSLIFIILNSGISMFVEDNFLKKTLTFAGLAATIFSAITTLNIMFIVGKF